MDITVLIIALVWLTFMEIVLGIDNMVFITIVTSRLPEQQQPLARRWGLILALLTRILLLFSLYYIVNYLTQPFVHLQDLGIPEIWLEFIFDSSHAEQYSESVGISWRDLILLGGGLFLIGKSVHEIHNQLSQSGHHVKTPTSYRSVLIQIAILDAVFSLDSVITAVGMVDEIWVMVTAIVIAMITMIVFAEPISRFVTQRPTVKMLALSFLILIGVLLVAEGVGAHLDKGYIYFAMTFAMIVELLNMKLRKPAVSAPA